MKRAYPKWIDEYIKSFFQFFKGMDLRTFEPLDCFHFHPLHSDLWQEHIYRAIDRFNRKKLPFDKAVKAFPNPSSTRAMFEFMVCHHHNLIKDRKNFDKKKMREIFDFFVKILREKNKRDIFCYKENIGHTDKEIDKLIESIKWQPGKPEISHAIGRLYLGASSLVNGLMNDWCTDNGIEVWGPYKVNRHCGPNTILVIRDFSRLKPVDLWPHAKNYKYDEIKIITIYKDVTMKSEFVGCHTIFEGDLAKNLLHFAVVVDGKYKNNKTAIDELSNYYIKLARSQYQRVKKLDFELLKRKVIAQEFYQLKDFFQLVDMDFRPHPIFHERIRGKKLVKKRYPLETSGMSVKDINRHFGIDNLKQLYMDK